MSNSNRLDICTQYIHLVRTYSDLTFHNGILVCSSYSHIRCRQLECTWVDSYYNNSQDHNKFHRRILRFQLERIFRVDFYYSSSLDRNNSH